jgi:peptidoglycan/LPS O-acetylase OafA/YrhL
MRRLARQCEYGTCYRWRSIHAHQNQSLGRHPGLRRILGSAPLQWLGNMGYSYFLIDGLVLNATAFILSRLMTRTSLPVPLFLVLMALNFVLTLVVASVLFRSIEWPCSLASGVDRGLTPAIAGKDDGGAQHKAARMGAF